MIIMPISHFFKSQKNNLCLAELKKSVATKVVQLYMHYLTEVGDKTGFEVAKFFSF